MTDELKKALESAKTEEEMKSIANKYKDEIKKLSEEELGEITGGSVMINADKTHLLNLWSILGINKEK